MGYFDFQSLNVIFGLVLRQTIRAGLISIKKQPGVFSCVALPVLGLDA